MAQIVVIEDEPVLRLTFRHILESAGHCVWDAGNGRDGIAQCREHRPDLVITDVIMPELSGNEAVAILQEEFPNMPVIAMSGLPVRTPVGRKGFCFVLKPIAPASLLGLVRSMLSPNANHSTPAAQ